MTESYTFEYQLDETGMAEAMVLAGQNLRMDAGRTVLSALLSVIMLLFMITGGAVLMLTLGSILGIEAFWPRAALGGALGAVLSIGWYNRLVRIMAKAVLDTPFNQGKQEMTFDRNGVTLRNPQAVWRTNWGGVHKVVAGKEGLGVLISGIVLPVPLDAFESAAQLEEVASQLDTWRQAAT